MGFWGADAIGWLALAAMRVIIIAGSLLFLPLLAVFMQLGPLLQELARLFPEIADQILSVLSGIQRIIEGLASGIKRDLALPENTGPVIVWTIVILGVVLLLFSLRVRDNRRRSAELVETEELQDAGMIRSLLGEIAFDTTPDRFASGRSAYRSVYCQGAHPENIYAVDVAECRIGAAPTAGANPARVSSCHAGYIHREFGGPGCHHACLHVSALWSSFPRMKRTLKPLRRPGSK